VNIFQQILLLLFFFLVGILLGCFLQKEMPIGCVQCYISINDLV
jgi:hypothetical protein